MYQYDTYTCTVHVHVCSAHVYTQCVLIHNALHVHVSAYMQMSYEHTHTNVLYIVCANKQYHLLINLCT